MPTTLDVNYFHDEQDLDAPSHPPATVTPRTTTAIDFRRLRRARRSSQPGPLDAQHQLRRFRHGLFVSAKIIDRNGGWKWYLLTEDIEFSANPI